MEGITFANIPEGGSGTKTKQKRNKQKEKEKKENTEKKLLKSCNSGSRECRHDAYELLVTYTCLKRTQATVGKDATYTARGVPLTQGRL